MPCPQWLAFLSFLLFALEHIAAFSFLGPTVFSQSCEYERTFHAGLTSVPHMLAGNPSAAGSSRDRTNVTNAEDALYLSFTFRLAALTPGDTLSLTLQNLAFDLIPPRDHPSHTNTSSIDNTSSSHHRNSHDAATQWEAFSCGPYWPARPDTTSTDLILTYSPPCANTSCCSPSEADVLDGTYDADILRPGPPLSAPSPSRAAKAATAAFALSLPPSPPLSLRCRELLPYSLLVTCGPFFRPALARTLAPAAARATRRSTSSDRRYAESAVDNGVAHDDVVINADSERDAYAAGAVLSIASNARRALAESLTKNNTASNHTLNTHFNSSDMLDATSGTTTNRNSRLNLDTLIMAAASTRPPKMSVLVTSTIESRRGEDDNVDVHVGAHSNAADRSNVTKAELTLPRTARLTPLLTDTYADTELPSLLPLPPKEAAAVAAAADRAAARVAASRFTAGSPRIRNDTAPGSTHLEAVNVRARPWSTYTTPARGRSHTHISAASEGEGQKKVRKRIQLHSQSPILTLPYTHVPLFLRKTTSSINEHTGCFDTNNADDSGDKHDAVLLIRPHPHAQSCNRLNTNRYSGELSGNYSDNTMTESEHHESTCGRGVFRVGGPYWVTLTGTTAVPLLPPHHSITVKDTNNSDAGASYDHRSMYDTAESVIAGRVVTVSFPNGLAPVPYPVPWVATAETSYPVVSMTNASVPRGVSSTKNRNGFARVECTGDFRYLDSLDDMYDIHSSNRSPANILANTSSASATGRSNSGLMLLTPTRALHRGSPFSTVCGPFLVTYILGRGRAGGDFGGSDSRSFRDFKGVAGAGS